MLDFVWTDELVYGTPDAQGNLRGGLVSDPHLFGHLIGKTKLTPLHSQMWRELWGRPDGEHTGQMGHRGLYKSTIQVPIGTVIWLMFHPDDRVGIIRKAYQSAASQVAVIRQIMEMEEVRDLFRYVQGKAPEFVVKQDGMLTWDFKSTSTPEGNVNAYGIHQVPTGTHLDRALCDDITTKDDRYSKAEREKTVNSLMELLSNIIDRGKTVMINGTPWHKDDIWSKVVERNNTIPNGVKRYPRAETGIISDAEYAKIAAITTPALLAINYDLKHVADDALLFSAQAGERTWSNDRHVVTAHLDAKFDGDCFMALTFMQQLPEKAPNGHDWIQASGWCSDKHVELIADEIVQRCIDKRVRHLFNESNPDKGMTYRLLMSKFAARGYLINLSFQPERYNYNEGQNKQYKIQTHLLHHWQNLLWDIDTDPAYMAMIQDYTDGAKPDDAPDSAASLLRSFYDDTNNTSNDPLWD